jgi:uncharacterized protein
MPTPKPTRKQSLKASSAFEKAMDDLSKPTAPFPNISLRWLLAAAAIALAVALACGWLTLCLLYWQGSWQFLYHPSATITRTPASTGITFEPIHFAATETGVTQLTGWWLPSPDSRHNVLYLHGADGNLSDTLNSLSALHRQRLAVFAIDYRGYGQSHAVLNGGRPSEKQLRQDAEWALTWLTLTRSLPPKSIVLYGCGLGANLAAELAADHSEVGGVILDQPLQDPLAPVFNDPRSKLVPAHWLVQDRYDLTTAAQSLKIPSLWLIAQPTNGPAAKTPQAYEAIASPKTAVTLRSPIEADPNYKTELNRWLDDLQ